MVSNYIRFHSLFNPQKEFLTYLKYFRLRQNMKKFSLQKLQSFTYIYEYKIFLHLESNH